MNGYAGNSYVRFANSTIRFVMALSGSAIGSQIVKWFMDAAHEYGRYDRVFVYHNGAESYYAARGFRGALRV